MHDQDLQTSDQSHYRLTHALTGDTKKERHRHQVNHKIKVVKEQLGVEESYAGVGPSVLSRLIVQGVCIHIPLLYGPYLVESPTLIL